ncbi:hypothetical protein [Parvimonas sp. G1967]|uniref:ApeA N-terminal domain 1-containing protein n=1 Tax=Parvimonas sp. G1967 TaxID=3387695 RepID=UPI0039E277AD
MPVCYFNQDYENKYRCEYSINDGDFTVKVEYDIHDEIPYIDGVKYFTTSTKYDNRDILIIDYDNKKNYLLKNAFYSGGTTILGNPDKNSTTIFQSNVYFSHIDFNKLIELKIKPKISKIKIFSKIINYLIGYPNLEEIKTDEIYSINLSKNKKEIIKSINKKNIKNIILGDSWKSSFNRKDHNISINFDGYIEIQFFKRVDYDKISSYINELITFMQIYIPNKFLIEKLYVEIDKTYFKFSTYFNKVNYTEKNIDISISTRLIEFLENCYKNIPYRNSGSKFRNIPYIVNSTTKSLEDNFLMFYKFIECYYQKGSNSIIKGLTDHYSSIETLIKDEFLGQETLEDFLDKSKLNEFLEQTALEIVKLRNHYVHSGYYIKNNCLNLKKGKTITNINIQWIFLRTRLLYLVAIDIIFKEMLGFEKYNYKKLF